MEPEPHQGNPGRGKPKEEVARGHPTAQPQEIRAETIGENWRPYSTSYFLMGRLEGKTCKLLVDTGCTTNLLSKHLFDTLPRTTRDQLSDYESHWILADGSQLPFYGTIRLTLRLRELRIQETFIVSKISEDAILGMPFLTQHKCAMEFGRSTLVIDGHTMPCVDRHGRTLSSSA